MLLVNWLIMIDEDESMSLPYDRLRQQAQDAIDFSWMPLPKQQHGQTSHKKHAALLWHRSMVYFVLAELLLQSDIVVPKERWSKAAQARRPPS